MIKCPSCGRQHKPGTLFCKKCGIYLPTGEFLRTEPLPEEELPSSRANPWATNAGDEKGPVSLRVTVKATGRQVQLSVLSEAYLGRVDAVHSIFPDLDLAPDGAQEHGVSRQHAKIHRRGGQLMIEDVGSANGTYINGRRLTPHMPYVFRNDDEIQLGSLALKFEIEDGTHYTPLNPYIAGAPVQNPRMFFGRKDIFEKIRTHLIGEHQDNVVVIYGQRRTGKTSVLYQLGHYLNDSEEHLHTRIGRIQNLGEDAFASRREPKTGIFRRFWTRFRRVFKRKNVKKVPELGDIVVPPQDLYASTRDLPAAGTRLIEKHYVTVLVDLQGLALDGIDNFLWELAQTIRRTLHRNYQLDVQVPDDAAWRKNARSTFQEFLLSSLSDSFGKRRLLLMFDEADRFEELVAAGRLEKDIFDYLRSLMQHQPDLSFVFSIGNKLERMQQEYALMFNTAILLKVSFLDEFAACDLITKPVDGLYAFDDATVERLLSFTSRHPYFTQLLCHSLFTHWEQERWTQVPLSEIERAADEAINLATANLQYIWNEANPTEKLVLAALAEVEPSEVNTVALSRCLEQAGIHLRQDEVTRALNELSRREVIASSTHPCFSVELVRRWVSREKPLNWVREELHYTPSM